LRAQGKNQLLVEDRLELPAAALLGRAAGALSLAQVHRDRGAVGEAQALLSATMSQFMEGATTPDHREAAALLAALTA